MAVRTQWLESRKERHFLKADDFTILRELSSETLKKEFSDLTTFLIINDFSDT